MFRLALIVTIVFCICKQESADAQEMEDVITLKDWSILRGMIIETIPDSTTRIQLLSGSEMVATMGAYIHEEKFYLHATGFVLRPDKTIELAGYSSGTISRMTADDALTLIKYLRRSS